jgi:hypothetical protein
MGQRSLSASRASQQRPARYSLPRRRLGRPRRGSADHSRRKAGFSTELVGKYSAFEEIDLEDYLAVRNRAVRLMADQDSYAALLVSMHTYNLLTERADRSTIRPDQLTLLDQFLETQKELQEELLRTIRAKGFSGQETGEERIRDHFRLLQATDNLSLLSCVGYEKPATLLHPLPLRDGTYTEVRVTSLGERHFRLQPWPFRDRSLTFAFPARSVEGKVFAHAAELHRKFSAAPVAQLTVTVTA